MPEITKDIKSLKFEEAERKWADMNRKIAMLTFPLASIFILNAELFITTLFGETYIQAAPIFSVFCCLVFVRVMSFGLVLRSINRTSLELYSVLIFLVISSIGVWMVIPSYGGFGAAIWVVGSTITLALILSLMTFIATEGRLLILKVYPVGILATTVVTSFICFLARLEFPTDASYTYGVFDSIVFFLVWAVIFRIGKHEKKS